MLCISLVLALLQVILSAVILVSGLLTPGPSNGIQVVLGKFNGTIRADLSSSTSKVDTAHSSLKVNALGRIDLETEQRFRVLIVEDNPTAANLLRVNLIRRNFEVECVAYLGLAMERVRKPGLDVILLDLSLPDSAGINTFYDLHARAPQIPVVILSAATDLNLAQAAIEGGAQDYLVKGIVNDESVTRCLRYAIERHKLERRVWESERLTRLIVENAPDAFVSMDAMGRITFWNIKAENMFGWFRKDAIGQSFADLIIPLQMRALFNQEVESFLTGVRGNLIKKQTELSLLHRSGKQFPAELTLFPVTIGSSYTLCAFIHDISQRKQIEKHLLQLNAQLETLMDRGVPQLPDSNSHMTLPQSSRFAPEDSGPITLSLPNNKSGFR